MEPQNPMQMPSKPLYTTPNGGRDNVTRQDVYHKKAYFFQREDGTIFHTDARDAWAILKGRKQIVGRQMERMRLIGVSEGREYEKAVKESHEIFSKEGLEKSQERLRKGLEEEIAIARQTIEMPPDPDTVDLHGNPFDIRNF